MEWFTNKGQVYHRACTGWSASVESGKCEQCGNVIPSEIVRLARDHASERARAPRHLEVQRRTANVSRKMAEMQARIDARLRRVPTEDREER